MSDLVLYTSGDGRFRLDLLIDGRTAWLTQLEIAELFQSTKQKVSLHAKNIFKYKELWIDPTVKESLTTAKRSQRSADIPTAESREKKEETDRVLKEILEKIGA